MCDWDLDFPILREDMIRTGVREKMVSFAVIFMVLFLVIESYMGDIQTVAVETEMLEPDGDLDLDS